MLIGTRRERNLMTAADSYKHSHHAMFPPDMRYLYSYFTARTGYEENIPFGFQGKIAKYLCGEQVTRAKIDAAERMCQRHFGRPVFNRAGWDHIWQNHNGRLPLIIKAVPEGKPVMGGLPFLTVQNTDPAVPWLTNFVETLLVQTWKTCTVATHSRQAKKIIKYWREKTGGLETLKYALHDFGFRAVGTPEEAEEAGAAHLINFIGSDTMVALEYIWDYYWGDGKEAESIPAAEHATICTWGRDGEGDAYAHILDQFGSGVVAVVSDSYDIEYACKVLWGSKLRDRVLKRDGILVVRPDSGEPVASVLGVLEALGSGYGFRTNKEQYHELPPQLRIIQGDGVNLDAIDHIYREMEHKKWSAGTVGYGMGNELLNNVRRDDYGYAMKACAMQRMDGVWVDVVKSPKGAEYKASKPGSWVREQEAKYCGTIFENGYLHNETNFAEIQKRAVL